MSRPVSAENDEKAKEMYLIELLLEHDEVFWAQRSRVNWLQLGDRNTSFFHNFASARCKKITITKLKDSEGDWVQGTEQLKPLILNYFANLFTSEVHAIDQNLLEKIHPRVDDSMNEALLSPFSADDVKKVAFSIGDLNAPGPHGLHAVFYKTFWDICGAEITQEVLQALNTDVIPDGWNDTTSSYS
jgi:hypothetical protein